MDETASIRIFDALAQTTRLRVYRLLLSRDRNGMDSGEIAVAAGLSKSAMSRSLAILAGAGLVRAERQGRRAVYTAVAGALADAATFAGTAAVADG